MRSWLSIWSWVPLRAEVARRVLNAAFIYVNLACAWRGETNSTRDKNDHNDRHYACSLCWLVSPSCACCLPLSSCITF